MIRLVLALAFGAGLLLALLLAALQGPFAPARFEYGDFRDYRGQLEWMPIPHLIADGHRWPLVATGKQGLKGSTPGLATLRGALIQRGMIRMLEVETGSLRILRPSSAPVAAPQSLGRAIMTGEIVDAKCYLGVMNPGAGTVHRACARRCLAGGLPAALVTPQGHFFWLGSSHHLAEFAGRRVDVRGELLDLGDLRYLRVESVTPRE
ncbi:MAG: hypothetical protein K2Q23_05205 [Bryobacteraceae bacterium]|nr:hypothetical protein [Bryobacteraceae bacterium]